jgi:hypothetical protein
MSIDIKFYIDIGGDNIDIKTFIIIEKFNALGPN